jgi:hypothetical protein
MAPGKRFTAMFVSTCIKLRLIVMGTCPTMVWPTDIHEAKNTTDSNIGVRQTVLDQVAAFALLDPGGQGAKTAIDFAHLTLQYWAARSAFPKARTTSNNRTDLSKVCSSCPHHAVPRRKLARVHRKCHRRRPRSV